MSKDDWIYVGHMVDHARKAIAKLTGKQRIEFDSDEDSQLIVTRLIEIVGEAARKLSTAFTQEHPEIPWKDMIAMRHRIAHDYMQIDLEMVWQTVVRDLPPLVEKLIDLQRGSGNKSDG